MIKNALRLLSFLLHAPRGPFFIAPRQLGAVESKSGRPSLPSVVGRTGQSGAHRTLSGARFPSLNSAVDRCRSGSRWRTGHVRCPLPTVGLATCRARNPRPTVGPSRPLAHRTVWCTPDSPVNFSRTPSVNSRERPLQPRQPGAPDTVRCTTGHCLVHHRTVRCPRPKQPLGCTQPTLFFSSSSCF
jgi:hypothetical protein